LDELADMPVEFTAFCELHRPRYLSYARVWFSDPGHAAEAVRCALRALAADWPKVLGSPNAAAAAWQIIRDTLAEQRSIAAPVGLRPGPADEDLAILHYVVGLATREIADVVGADTASVTGRLRHAERTRPSDR
jgi:DNA-directed RNA polymerase specialized sigma24 family protein